MKIMVCGKGGSGKTVLTILMAKVLLRKFKVYIIDSDESNSLLPSFLGVKQPKPLVEYVGGKREEEDFERMEPDIVKALSMARGGIKLSSLPSEYIVTSSEGVSLVTIGKVREYGEGCACPFNILTRILLGNLSLEEDEVVLIDTDAGVEHIGRRVEEVSDGIIVVVDPTAESLELALMLMKVAEKLGKSFWVIANKITEDIKDSIFEEASKMGLNIDGVVRFDKELYTSCLKREPLKSSIALSDVERIIWEKILPKIVRD
ncbi:MAG: ATP-binding protein [Candidatus Bathyarchaeia archaeon]|nr:ATP-binding protein [Candidatus Bathyarchaeota archaeon]